MGLAAVGFFGARALASLAGAATADAASTLAGSRRVRVVDQSPIVALAFIPRCLNAGQHLPNGIDHARAAPSSELDAA